MIPVLIKQKAQIVFLQNVKPQLDKGNVEKRKRKKDNRHTE